MYIMLNSVLGNASHNTAFRSSFTFAAHVSSLGQHVRLSFVSYWFSMTTLRMSSASWRTRSSLVSHEHMKRAPPTPMNV